MTRRAGRAVLRLAAGLWALSALVTAPIAAQDVGRAGAAGPAGPVLTLAEAVELGLERNRDLEQAMFTLEEAEEQVDEAWGSVYPSLDLVSSYTRSISPPVSFLPAEIIDPDATPGTLVPVQFGADNSWQFQLRAEQPLFAAGAFIGVGAAGRFEELQNETVRGVAQDVATRVRIAYYDVLLGAEGVRLNRNSLRRIEQTLEETRAMYRAGLVSEYETLRLEVERANVATGLGRAENQHAAAKRTLAVEVGLEPNADYEVAGSLAALELGEMAENSPENAGVVRLAGLDAPETLDVEEVIDVALQNRSDLRQIALTADLRRTELKVAWSEYLPRVSLFGTYSISAQQNGAPDFFGSGQERGYGRQVGVEVTLPVFTGFERQSRVEQRQAVVNRVEAQYALARDRVENLVKTLLERLREAREAAEAQRLAVGQAERGFEIASAEYREGIGGRLQVTEAEVALRESEFNYAQAVYDYLAARAQLDEATGSVPLTENLNRVAID